MKIAVIDADFIGRKKHSFPNLVCMKISAYHKNLGDVVELKTNYNNLEKYDKVYIAKVFTDTKVPEGVIEQENVIYGGTGFFYDKAEPLPYEMEHTKPDYDLYKGVAEGKFYTDYSIGYLTRGCFRKCSFCVNQKYNSVVMASPLSEFMDESKKKLCFLDDNFLGYPGWREVLQEVIASGKPYQFRQGLDERLLTDEKCELIFNSKYDGEVKMAFDNVEDCELIEQKLQLLRKHSKRRHRFYVLCAFDRGGKYDREFWNNDIKGIFTRAKLLNKYDCIPYLMRYKEYENSPYRGMYINLAAWMNQTWMYKKTSLRQFVAKRNGAGKRYLDYFCENVEGFDLSLLDERNE